MLGDSMNWNFFLSLVFIFLFYNCIYIQNQKLSWINYPETAYFSGFWAGRSEANEEYFQKWCNRYCKEIKEVTLNLPETHYLEIRGKMDATELPTNRERLSLGRALSIKKLLSAHGIPQDKMKAIADPEPDQYLGRDKFDPENRVVRFRIQEDK